MGKFIYITGGARSGKSSFAEELAGEFEKVTYIATAQGLDDEMQERIMLHRLGRNPLWKTIEAPLDVAKFIIPGVDCYLIDCITLLVTNILLQNPKEEKNIESQVESQMRAILCAAEAFCGTVIAVSNEVGMGLVPSTPLGRIFRDIAGRANQLLAKSSTEAYALISGIPIKLK